MVGGSRDRAQRRWPHGPPHSPASCRWRPMRPERPRPRSRMSAPRGRRRPPKRPVRTLLRPSPSDPPADGRTA